MNSLLLLLLYIFLAMYDNFYINICRYGHFITKNSFAWRDQGSPVLSKRCQFYFCDVINLLEFTTGFTILLLTVRFNVLLFLKNQVMFGWVFIGLVLFSLVCLGLD